MDGDEYRSVKQPRCCVSLTLWQTDWLWWDGEQSAAAMNSILTTSSLSLSFSPPTVVIFPSTYESDSVVVVSIQYPCLCETRKTFSTLSCHIPVIKMWRVPFILSWLYISYFHETFLICRCWWLCCKAFNNAFGCRNSVYDWDNHEWYCELLLLRFGFFGLDISCLIL